LLFGDRAGVDRGVERDGVVFELRERLTGEGATFAAVDPAEPPGFLAKQDVFLDAEVRRQVQFLVDHRDPASPRVQRIGGAKRRALELEVARVRHVRAAEDLHQRAFAGAILPDERVDFTGSNLQRDILECACGAEALPNFDHPEAGSRHDRKVT
jgi:hypothetical protein